METKQVEEDKKITDDNIQMIGKVVLRAKPDVQGQTDCPPWLGEIFTIVQNHPQSEYPRVIEERKKWEILYHLSPMRENLIEWIPFRKTDRVLEIGSQCGAITGVLTQKAGIVDCVEASWQQSKVNALRHQDSEHLTIMVGDWKEIEPTLSETYDYIILTDMFAFAQDIIGGKRPFADSLVVLRRHLAKQGRILLATANKYGLKYFAGCREDHSGAYFAGIENYVGQADSARTFGRAGLEEIFYQAGYLKAKFYYPYPDHIFPTAIYSELYLPSKGELTNNIRNFDRDRMILFDEKNAFDGILEERLYSIFANSFLVVLGEDFPAKYVKYSNDRAPEYAIRTQIERDMVEGTGVYKIPLTQQATEHIKRIDTAYRSLKDRYDGGGLEINPCTLVEKENRLCAALVFEEGVPLSKLMDQHLERGDRKAFYELFHEFVKRVGYKEEYPVADYDTIFANIMVKGNRWTLIDYEWTFAKAIPIKEQAYRAIANFIVEDPKRAILGMDQIQKELSVSEEEAQRYDEMEVEFQQYVTGNRSSMSQLRNKMGKQLIQPIPWFETHADPTHVKRVQIYEDTGAGYQEETSYFITQAYTDEDTVVFDITVSDLVKAIRVDPCMDSCLVKVRSLTWNDHSLSLLRKRIVVVNGSVKSSELLVFPTTDPNINIRVERLPHKKENHLRGELKIALLTENMAKELADHKKESS
ncbi:MAG: class I SAM-dependent methyltransferase [Lachnospiraceae bacterium]|jgi:hypothetical protein|nr:class I SAM-dependent methyltransferase [Lachnospiraceae bacterium]